MKVYSGDNSELMEITALARDGSNLIIKGKIFGTMPMTAKLHPAEARKVIKLLDWKLVLFLLTFLFRRSA